MIYVTGGLHGNPFRLSNESFPEQMRLTRDDYVVVLGDFGLLSEPTETKREAYQLDWLEQRNFTTLFLDGNHENFNRLNNSMVEIWNGGFVHRIRNHVLHLMRGQIYFLQTDDSEFKTIWTFGGARSQDIRDGILESDSNRIKKANKQFQIQNWWPEECQGVKNLERVFWNVDYVFTHDCGLTAKQKLKHMGYKIETDDFDLYLEDIKNNLCGKWKWYFGHHHGDVAVSENEFSVHKNIIKLN